MSSAPTSGCSERSAAVGLVALMRAARWVNVPCAAISCVPLVLTFITLLFALAPAASYADGTPGAGVVDPNEWAKDYIENKFKDAIFGSEISEGMDAIIQRGLVRTFDGNRNRNKGCRGAAFNQADNVVSNLRHQRN